LRTGQSRANLFFFFFFFFFFFVFSCGGKSSLFSPRDREELGLDTLKVIHNGIKGKKFKKRDIFNTHVFTCA
tara:strand:+ start:392 stop:607 length:216 start_codon:yes stop_codon:yes gene_type:complete